MIKEETTLLHSDLSNIIADMRTDLERSIADVNKSLTRVDDTVSNYTNDFISINQRIGDIEVSMNDNSYTDLLIIGIRKFLEKLESSLNDVTTTVTNLNSNLNDVQTTVSTSEGIISSLSADIAINSAEVERIKVLTQSLKDNKDGADSQFMELLRKCNAIEDRVDALVKANIRGNLE